MSATSSSRVVGMAGGALTSVTDRLRSYGRDKCYHEEWKRFAVVLVGAWLVGYFVVAFAVALLLVPLSLVADGVMVLAGWAGFFIATAAVGRATAATTCKLCFGTVGR